MWRKSLIIDSFVGRVGGGGVYVHQHPPHYELNKAIYSSHHHEVEVLAKCRLPPSPRPSSLMAQGHMDTDASISFKTKPPPPSSPAHTDIFHTTSTTFVFFSFSLLCNNLESYLDWMFTESSNVGFGGSRNSIAGYACSEFACYLGLR